jgi:hypothetical protein
MIDEKRFMLNHRDAVNPTKPNMENTAIEKRVIHPKYTISALNENACSCW